jgi:hypothetical protein
LKSIAKKPKPKFSLGFKDPRSLKLMEVTDQKTLARWAIDCAERVMPFFEKRYPKDPRPRNAIDALKTWIKTGKFSMAVIRHASLSSHAAAREVEPESPAQSAARAAGQAVATAHVWAHAIGPAMYAAQAILRATEPDKAEKAVAKEREWQYRRLVKLCARKSSYRVAPRTTKKEKLA